MRKVVIPLALPVLSACLFVSPAHAETTIGGERLSGSGYIWDHSSRSAEPPHIAASSYVIADLETGAVLAAKDPHGHYRPASTLKTLTSITLIPKLDPHMKMKPSSNAVNATGSAVGMGTLSWKPTRSTTASTANAMAIRQRQCHRARRGVRGLPRTLAATERLRRTASRPMTQSRARRTASTTTPPLTLQQQHSSVYDLALHHEAGDYAAACSGDVGLELNNRPAPPSRVQRKKGKSNRGDQIGI